MNFFCFCRYSEYGILALETLLPASHTPRP